MRDFDTHTLTKAAPVRDNRDQGGAPNLNEAVKMPSRLLTYLDVGSYFGELSVHADIPRQVCVRTFTHVCTYV